MGWRVHVGIFDEHWRISDYPQTSSWCRGNFLGFFCCEQSQSFDYLKGTCVGQASNPGPWTLQLRNIVSAAKHIENFAFSSDCHVWSETSATKATQDKAVKATRGLRGHVAFSDFSKCRHEDGLQKPGKAVAVGTMIFSKSRLQCLSAQWPAPLFRSARISDAVLQVGIIQVRVVAVYGYNSGIADHVSLNDALLGKVFNQVRQFHLPTLVVGDFNCDLYELTAWNQAVAQGFVDVAARQASLLGETPDFTYKGISRLDYVLCNRAAAQAFCSIEVDPAGYSDHAILQASFNWANTVPSSPSGKMPVDFTTFPDVLPFVKDWTTDADSMRLFRAAIQVEDLDAALAAFVQGFEKKVASIFQQQSANPLPKDAFGRCKGKMVTPTRTAVTTDKPSSVATDRATMSHRILTVQRCREILYLRKRNRDMVKCGRLSRKVMLSKGFSPDFATWLLDADIVAEVPLQCPDVPWFQHVLQALESELHIWSLAEARQKRIRISQCMQLDWASGGRRHAAAIKPLSLGTLESLTVSERRKFRILRSGKGLPAQVKLLDDKPTPIGSVWKFPGGTHQAKVVSVQGQFATFDIPAHITMTAGHAIQTAWSTDTDYIAHQIQDFWLQYWQTSRRPDMQGVSKLAQQLPDIPAFEPWITPEEILWVLRRMQTGKARGMDGFSMAELRSFGMDECSQLAQLYNVILKTSRWPSQLRHAYVALLAKVPFPQTAKDARPITVLPGLYRLFGKIMTQKIFKATLPYLPSDLYGSVPGKSTMDAAWEIQCLFEESMHDGDSVSGASLDLSKAYNTIDRSVLRLLAIKCGWPQELVDCYSAYLDGLERCFSVHNGLHLPTRSSTGVPEGCPIAVPAMILVTWLVTVNVENKGRLVSYVDNWSFLAKSVPSLLHMMDKVFEANQALSLLLNPDKTRVFSTAKLHRKELSGSSFAGHTLKPCMMHDDSGVWFSSTRKACSKAINERLVAAEPKFRRLELMPWSAQRKASVALRVIWPSVSYGVAVASVPPSLVSRMRAKFSGAIWGRTHHRNHFLTPLYGTKTNYEPFLLICRMRLSALRRAWCRQPAVTCKRWNTAMSVGRVAGPLQYLFHDVKLLGWTIMEDGIVQTQHGPLVSFLQDDWSLLLRTLDQAWFNYVASQLSHKPEFEYLALVNVDHSQLMRQRSKHDVTMLGCFTTGAALTTEHKQHFLDVSESLCRHCGEEDTQRHRMPFCTAHEECRIGLGTKEMQDWPSLMVERGLVSCPSTLENGMNASHSN